MGRRSVNTTKSGRFMNPTDQARKEARKRELKRNKKQRMAVRHAVLKAKDPLQLLEETALYDKQEYDPSVESQLNERVIQEKRRKILETFDNLIRLYRKEDANYAKQLQNARETYDKRRHEMMLFYEQVKLAERVKTSDIPLPKLPQSQMSLLASDIPLPSGSYSKGILKKSSIPGLPPTIIPPGKKPPGPPPGSPPSLSDSEDEAEGIAGITTSDSTERDRTIRFAGEEVGSDLAAGSKEQPSLSTMPGSLPSNPGGFSVPIPPLSQIPLPPPNALPSAFGQPLIRPPSYLQAPPGQIRFAIQRPGAGSSVQLSAPPSLVAPTRDPLDNTELTSARSSVPKGAQASSAAPNTIIEARPQLKNLLGDATRFVPTSLKVRRTGTHQVNRGVGSTGGHPAGGSASNVYDRSAGSVGSTAAAATNASKDDAYEEFMREMGGLL